MVAPHPAEPLRTLVRRHAAAGAWGDVCAVLGEHADAARREPELAVLGGEALLRSGRARDAHRWLAEALPWVTRSGDRAALRRAVNLDGAARFDLGDLEGAAAAFGRALELGRVDGDDLLVARATNNLGAIANVRGRHDHALAHYQLAIPAYQRLGHTLGLAECYHNMAITFRGRRQLERADECERRAVEFAREASDPRLAAMASVGRAEVHLRTGDAAFAAATARRAAADFAAIPDPAREADALRVAGVASLTLGDIVVAREAIERAVVLARAHGIALVEAESLRARAELEARAGAPARALDDAWAALARFDRLGATEECETLRAWIGALLREA